MSTRKLYTQEERDALVRALETPAKAHVMGAEPYSWPITPPEQKTDTHTVTCPRCDLMFKVDLDGLHEGCE